MPNREPAVAIEVTLPVPIVYPMQKMPGPTSNRRLTRRLSGFGREFLEELIEKAGQLTLKITGFPNHIRIEMLA